MDDTQAKRILEALLFVASQPLALKRIGEVVPELHPLRIRALMEALNVDYISQQRAVRVQEVAGGYQFVTDETLAPWIAQALQGHRPDAVSKAALETLAIIAYRQPITKAEIEMIRGVDVSASLEALIERRFARVAGRKDSPGRPFLYGTTSEFLRHFGLKSLEALPPMAQPSLSEPHAEPAAIPPSPAEPTPAAVAATASAAPVDSSESDAASSS